VNEFFSNENINMYNNELKPLIHALEYNGRNVLSSNMTGGTALGASMGTSWLNMLTIKQLTTILKRSYSISSVIDAIRFLRNVVTHFGPGEIHGNNNLQITQEWMLQIVFPKLFFHVWVTIGKFGFGKFFHNFYNQDNYQNLNQFMVRKTESISTLYKDNSYALYGSMNSYNACGDNHFDNLLKKLKKEKEVQKYQKKLQMESISAQIVQQKRDSVNTSTEIDRNTSDIKKSSPNTTPFQPSKTPPSDAETRSLSLQTTLDHSEIHHFEQQEEGNVLRRDITLQPVLATNLTFFSAYYQPLASFYTGFSPQIMDIMANSFDYFSM
jgi:hypothetical protein